MEKIRLSFVLILVFIASSLNAQDTLALSFSPVGGIYNAPQKVVLSSSLKNARIFYTLDGSEPSGASLKYNGPIQVKTVLVIRAVAYGEDGKSKVITQSYFCDRKYTLPIVSIATEPANLWDYSSGIYVKGCCADTIPPYLGANFWYDWERKANIELYESNGACAFNQVAGIGVFGGFSKGLPQKSLYVTARDKYGDNNFRYPIFPEKEKIKKYKSFILRNAGGDFGKTHLRDAFMTQLAKPTGIAIQAYRPAIVFLNGQYWGIQNLREKINEHYLEDNFGVDKDNVDLMEHRDGAKHGTSKEYKKLLNFLATKDMKDDKVVEELSKFMDIQNYMTYNIAEVYSDNRDAGGNIRYFKERNDSARWQWILYDTEMGLNNNNPNGYKNNTLKKFTSVNNEIWPDPPWSTFIIRSLLTNKKLEIDYINLFADQLNTVYHKDTANRLLDKLIAGVKEEMPFHQKRWGTSMDAWYENIASLRLFATQRPFYLRKFLMEKFQLTDTVYISVAKPSEAEGKIRLNSLKIKRDFKGVYFTKVPITITATAKHDYEFIGWKDRKETSNSLTIIPEKDEIFIPIFKPKKASIYKDSLIFNEIYASQPDEDTTGDWVELYNRSKAPINLSGWVFTDGDYDEGYKVPEGLQILPGNYFILSQFGDPTAFDFGLSSKGEHIKIYDQLGFLVDSLTYFKIKNKEMSFKSSWNLTHPDSCEASFEAWVLDSISPELDNLPYTRFIRSEAEKAYWTKVLFIGGGGFFFILVAGLWFFRRFRKTKII